MSPIKGKLLPYRSTLPSRAFLKPKHLSKDTLFSIDYLFLLRFYFIYALFLYMDIYKQRTSNVQTKNWVPTGYQYNHNYESIKSEMELLI